MSWQTANHHFDLKSKKGGLQLLNAQAGITIGVHVALPDTDHRTATQIDALLKATVKAALLEAAASLP